MGDKKKDDLEELKKELHREPEIQEFKSKIFYDGKQYNARIPSKLAKMLGLDLKPKRLHFSLHIPSTIKENFLWK